jgi:hypothetical protein
MIHIFQPRARTDPDVSVINVKVNSKIISTTNQLINLNHMQTFTLFERSALKKFAITSLLLFFGVFLQAQTTYYSKPAAVNFANTASWGANADGSGAAPGSISNADNFIIQNGSAMVLNASANVRNLTITAGSLSVAANTLTVSLPTGNTAACNVTATGSLTVSGGTININGSFNVLTTGAFNQSGGNINVDGNAAGVAANSVASGSSIVLFTSVTLNLTGGTLTIVDPHANTTASSSFTYNAGTAYNSGAGHNFRFGNGVSTDAGGNVIGFRHDTWFGSGRFLFGALVVDALAGTNRFVTSVWSHGMRSLTINSGEYRTTSSPCAIEGNLTVNAGGTLTANSTVQFSTYLGGATAASTLAQTVSGAGVFRNSPTVPTANFLTLTVNNTNPAGVTFSGANSLLSGANTGTVSGTLNLTNGGVNTSGGTFILGVSTAAVGTLGTTVGGFTSGSTFRRWVGATTLTLSATPTTAFFPFVSGFSSRLVRLNRFTGATTTAGWVQATYANGAGGLTPAGFLDGAYNVQQRSNASWSFSGGAGFSVTGNLALGLSGDGIVFLAALPGAAPRLTQAAAALGTHVGGSGTAALPFANRTLSGADFISAAHHIGVATADLGLFSVASANWNLGSTWSTGSVPTALENPLITAGTTVTVNSAIAVNSISVNGTLSVTGGTLSVTGAAASGISVSNGGTLSIGGGTLNLTDGTNNNRRLIVNGTLDVSSGNLNIDGNILFNASGFYTQSGGTITIDGNGTTSSSLQDLLRLENASANFNVTGGALNFVDPPATALNTIGYTFGAGDAVWGSGHITTFGNGVSTASGPLNGFRIDPWIGSAYLHLGSLVVNGATGTNRFLTHAWTNMPFTGNVTVNAGSEARFQSLHVGGNLLNNGLLTATTGILMEQYRRNTGTSAATLAQSIGGSGTYQNLLAAPTAMAATLSFRNSSAGGVTLNIPFTQNGQLIMFEGRVNTTLTNVLTHIKTGAANNVFVGTSTAAYVDGPFRATFPASFTNATCFMPVGVNAPTWMAFFNLTTSAGGPVTLQAIRNNSIALPNTVDGSLLSLSPGAEWVTSIISGAANLTSFSTQIHDNSIVSGRAQAAIQAPAVNFSAFGSGSTFGAAGTLPASLALNVPAITGANFPDRIAIGVTGPLNLTSVSLEQSTAAGFTAATAPGSVNNNAGRFNFTAVGSSGTIAITDLVLTYTGTAPAGDITNVTLWTGTFAAPVALVPGATATISGGLITYTGISIPITSGNNFVWVRCDFAGAATIGNTFDFQLNAGNLTGFALTGGATATPPLPGTNQLATGSVLIDYCTPTYASGCGGGADAITNVVLNGSTLNLSNASGCALAPFYTFFSAATRPDLQQGSSYPISITMGADGNQFSRVWVDFNQDGIFAAGESFSAATNAGSGGTSTFNIVVPGGATLGFTRMRVRGGDDAAITTVQACGASGSAWGETEDYTIEITAVTPASISSITATQQTGGMGANTLNNNLLRVNIGVAGSAGTLTLNQMRFTYTGTAAADIAAAGVSLWVGNATAPTAQIGTSQSLVANLANFTGLTTVMNPGTNYLWLRVNTSVGAVITNLVDAFIDAGDITIVATGGAIAPGSQPVAIVDPASERFIDYCVPTYSNGCGSGDAITNVVLNGNSINLSNASACAALPYYTFFNAANVPDLFQGSSYTVAVTFGADGNQWAGIWLDFDNDGLLETSEFFQPAAITGGGGTANITITVPPTAFIGGPIRMRVRGGDDVALSNTQACGASNSSWGETEDYRVQIIVPPVCSGGTGMPPSATTLASVPTLCLGSSLTLTFNPSAPMPNFSGITYRWEWATTGAGPWTSLATTVANNYTFTPTLANGPFFRCVPLCSNVSWGLIATAVNPTISSSTISAAAGSTRCGQGNVTFTATGTGTINWFDDALAGNLVGTGSPFVTSIPATTTLYAAAVSGGLTEVGGKPAPTDLTGFTPTAGWGLRFNVNTQLTLTSTVIYPNGLGTIDIALLNSAGTEIVSTGSIAVSGTNTPVIVPLGFTVPVGTNYRLVVKSASGLANLYRDFGSNFFPYNSPSNALVINESWNGAATAGVYYYFYNIQISTGCLSPRVAATATVTPPTPLVLLPGASTAVCEGTPVNLSVLSGDLGYVYTWDNGLGVGASKSASPVVNTNYTVTAVNGGTGCNTTGTISVTVNPRPSLPSVSPTSVTYCPIPVDVPTLVTGSASAVTIVLNETFENPNPAWTRVNNSTGGTPANAAWTDRNSPHTTNLENVSSGSRFAFTDSDAQGSGGTTATELISPVFAISAGATAASLSFRHYHYVGFEASTAIVEISTNGGTSYANLATYTSDQGTFNSFANVTIPLTGYINQSNLRLRFRYSGAWSWYWGIDDVVVNQTQTATQFSWSPAGGLFNDLATTTAYVDGNLQSQVYAAPFTSTTYNVRVANPVTGCLSLPASTTITVCSAVTDIICGAITTSVFDAPPTSVAAIPTYNSSGSSTGGQAGTCQAFTNDIWFKMLVPASGDIHVYTYASGVTLTDLQKAMITIFQSSDGTCSGTLTQVACDDGGASGDFSYASAAGLNSGPGLYAYVRVSTPVGSTPAAGRFKLYAMSGLFWTGAANSNFNNPSNWYGGDISTPLIAPDQNKTIIVSNNSPVMPVINTPVATVAGVSFRNASLLGTASIDIPSASQLRIQSKVGVSITKKAFVRTIGSFAAATVPIFTNTGIVRFNELASSNNQAEILNNVRFDGVVGVRSGVTVESNGRMRFNNNSVLLSGGVATADVNKNYAGTVTGNIAYTRAGSSYANYNYWSSPVVGATTATLSSSYGNNVYAYDNTIATIDVQTGWGTPIVAPVVMAAGRGYIQTFAGNGQVTFTGPPREGFLNAPVTVGLNPFNLVGNPYPSSLSYASLKTDNPTQLGSVYLWSYAGVPPYSTASYAVVSGPAGSPIVGGNAVAGFTVPEIGAGQSFFTNVAGAGVIAFNSNQRVSEYPGNSTQFLEENTDYSVMKVRLQNPSSLTFDAAIAFGDGATEGFDHGLDAPRLPLSDVLDLYSYIGTEGYTIQFSPKFVSTKIVDLGTVMSLPGDYTFSLSEFTGFDPSILVFIEDVQTGSFENLNNAGTYTFTNDPSFQGVRFRLHFTSPIQMSTTGTCIGEATGKILLANTNTTLPLTADLLNSAGETVATSGAFTGEYVFQGLTSGAYVLRGTYAGAQPFEVPASVDGGPISVPATFTASSYNLSIADAIVEFAATAPNATQITWDFGDGTIITGDLNPVHAYMTPGVYTVTFTALNSGCGSVVTATVTVTANATGLANVEGVNGFTIYPNPANEVASLLLNLDRNESQVVVSIHDAAGRLMNSRNVNDVRAGSIVGLDIDGLANGIYQVTVEGKNFKDVGRLTISK